MDGQQAREGAQRRPAPGGAWTSFFTTGTRYPYGGSYVIIDQAYVQFHAPATDRGRRPLPLVLVHGGGLSGAVWEATPDGRTGWAPRAAAEGWPVFVVDTVDGGRSGRAPDSARHGEPEWRTAEQIWTRYRIGSPEGCPERRAFPGQQFPVEHFDHLVASYVTRRRTTDAAEAAALVEVIRTVGPCCVIAHSHGASVVARALDEVEREVEEVVLVEPLPFVEPLLPGGRVLLVWGDHVTGHPLWAGAVDAYRASTATPLPLSERGVVGASHVPMSDRSSDQVLRLVLDWLTTRGPAGPGACGQDDYVVSCGPL